MVVNQYHLDEEHNMFKRVHNHQKISEISHELRDMSTADRYGKIIVYHKFFYCDPAECEQKMDSISDFIMLDNALDMEITFPKTLRELNCNMAEPDESIINLDAKMIDSIIFFYGPKENSIPKIDELRKWPLLFVTAIHCTQEQRDKIKEAIESIDHNNSNYADTELWIFPSLDTASLVLLLNTRLYSTGTRLIYELLSKFPGSVFNTQVGCWRTMQKNWIEENLHFGVSFAQKNPIVLKDFDDYIKRIGKRVQGINPLSCTGNCDRAYLFDSISSKEIIKIIKLLHDKENLYYEVRMQLYLTDQTQSSGKYEIPNQFDWQEKLSREIHNFRKDVVEKLASKNSGPIASEILKDMLDRLLSMLSRIEKSPVFSPLSEMLAYSFSGFSKIYPASFEQDKSEAFHSVSSYLYEMLRIHESTSLNLSLLSQTPGRTEIFRAVSARLIFAYYCLADRVSFLLRECDDTSEVDQYYYLFVPDVFPAVRIKSLFPSVEPPAERLLIVGFPQKMLFRPAILLPSLIHEIAHYAGDRLRLRKERAEFLMRAISFFMAGYLLSSTFDEESRDDRFVKISALFYKLLKESLSEISPNGRNSEGPYYLKNMEDIVYIAFQKLADSEIMFEVIDVFNEEPLAFSARDEKRAVIIEEVFRRIREYMKCFLHELIDVCSETYSDLVAITLLSMSAHDYYNMLFLNSTSLDYLEETPPLLFERIHIVV